jgi:hypothetical protein
MTRARGTRKPPADETARTPLSRTWIERFNSACSVSARCWFRLWMVGPHERSRACSEPRERKMEESHAARETRLRELASRLLFTLSKEGSRFSLFRDTDVSQPIRHDGLTLDEVEEKLNTWKLRGPHGG